MTALLRVLSGARKGHIATSESGTIRVGRSAGVELRFDPEFDLDVSGQHATIRCEHDRWWISDADSRNGTFVNGQQIVKETELRDGDQLGFGARGPVVEFRSIPSTEAGSFAATDQGVTRPTMQVSESPTGRVRRAVASNTRTWTLIVAAIVLVLSGVIGMLMLQSRSERKTWERERTALLAEMETALSASERTIRSLKGDLNGLAEALSESREQVRAAGTQLQRAERGTDGAQITALRNQLNGAMAQLSSQQGAAALDHEAIRRRNQPAVARIYSESQSGVVGAGTAFAVRSDGTLVTSRHLVQSAEGQPSRRIAVQFSHSDQVWPARVLAVDPELDVAIVKVDAILGSVPTVQALNLRADTIPNGAPVLLIGNPMGGDAMPSSRVGRTTIVPTVGAGVVTAMGAKQLELRGYGATGSSGSPIFDRDGGVVGIVFGGRKDADSHYLVGVPASVADRLLATLPVSRR